MISHCKKTEGKEHPLKAIDANEGQILSIREAWGKDRGLEMNFQCKAKECHDQK